MDFCRLFSTPSRWCTWPLSSIASNVFCIFCCGPRQWKHLGQYTYCLSLRVDWLCSKKPYFATSSGRSLQRYMFFCIMYNFLQVWQYMSDAHEHRVWVFSCMPSYILCPRVGSHAPILYLLVLHQLFLDTYRGQLVCGSVCVYICVGWGNSREGGQATVWIRPPCHFSWTVKMLCTD